MNMRKLKLVLVICIFTAKSSSAQFENTDIGARAIGLNGAFTSHANNSLAIFYNPSGLGQLKYREVSAFYSPSQFGISEISTVALTYAEPLGTGTFGFGIKAYGFDLYRETNAVLSYGNNFKDKIFFGLNLDFYNLSIKNYNSASAFGADIGSLAYITDFLKWGFYAKNISGAKIGESKHRIAQVYRTGFTIQPRNDVALILEVEKDTKFPLSFRSGLEYSVNDFIDLRGGVATQPASFSGGVSINYNLFQIEYAVNNYRELGFSNYASLTINFGGGKARKFAREQLKNAFR